jgi:hypothetical protein
LGADVLMMMFVVFRYVFYVTLRYVTFVLLLLLTTYATIGLTHLLSSIHPSIHDITQVDITVQFKPLADASSDLTYELQWKEVQQSWDTHKKSVAVNMTTKTNQEAVATPLNPGATYCVRLVCLSNGEALGEASHEIVVDTEQVGCTPTPDKSCCVVL